MNSRKLIGYISLILILIISSIIFYEFYTIGSHGRGLIYDTIISVVFAIISYLMHSILNSYKIVTGLTYGYYILSIVYFASYVFIFDEKLINISVLLVYVLFSMPFIYWSIGIKNKTNSRLK